MLWALVKEEEEVVTHAVAAMWRHLPDFCLCSPYCDAEIKKCEVLRVELHACTFTVCVLHVVRRNVSGVRVSFFQVTLFLQVPLLSRVILNVPLYAHFAVYRLFCLVYVLMSTSLNNYIDVVGCSDRMVWFSYHCFDELS
jgi:hypothetical protein